MFSSFFANISVRDWREGNSMAQIALIGEDRQMSVRGDMKRYIACLWRHWGKQNIPSERLKLKLGK